MFISESLEVQQVAHVSTDVRTAMIPFCEFGGNMSVMGVKIEQFDVPFCNSFRPKIVMDQLCYQVDPNEYKDKINLEGDMSLSLFIHYNEDRQMEDIEEMVEPLITIDTISNNLLTKTFIAMHLYIRYESFRSFHR